MTSPNGPGHDWHRVFFDLLGLEKGEQTDDGGYRLPCPLPGHDDKHPSFAVWPDSDKGGWNCKGCGEQGGGVDLYGRLKLATYKPGDRDSWIEASNEIHDKLGTRPYKADKKKKREPDPIPSEEEIAERHEELLATGRELRHLVDDRKWSMDVIREFQIGWDPKARRVWIPIRHESIPVNIRRYLPKHHRSGKGGPKCAGLRGATTRVVFPDSAFDDMHGSVEFDKLPPIWIVEGEPDALAARSAGLNAITFLQGATSVPQKSLPLFKGRHLVFCYDLDPAGDRGAALLLGKLRRGSASVRTVNLADAAAEQGAKTFKGDLTDFIAKGLSVERLQQFAEQLPNLIGANPSEEDETIYLPPLYRALLKEFEGRRIQFERLQVVAVADHPFTVDTKIQPICDRAGDFDRCANCQIALQGATPRPWVANFRRSDLVRQIGISDAQLAAFHRKVLGVPAKCDVFEIDRSRSASASVFEVILMESVDLSVDQVESSVRQATAYAIGDRFDLNQSYSFEGTMVRDPKTQSALLFFHESEPVDDDLDTFELDFVENAVHARLRELTAIDYPSARRTLTDVIEVDPTDDDIDPDLLDAMENL